jgi:hypothetical protein
VYPTSPKHALPLSAHAHGQEPPIFGAHRRPAPSPIPSGAVDVSVVAPAAAEATRARAEFSLEVHLPDPVPGDSVRLVRYCDVCRRWGQRGSVHLCGRNWYQHLGELLVVVAGGGAR